MPLLRKGRLAEDARSFIGEDAPISDPGAVILSLKRFASERDALLAHNTPLAVRLGPSDDPGILAEHLDRINLIEVEIPKYTDGRGYSTAELLRRRYGYTGELRAVGQVLRDQLFYLTRVGFDAVLIDAEDAEAVFADAVGAFAETYQAAADGRVTVFQRRHPKNNEKAG